MFIINLIPLHVFVLLLMQRYSRRVYIGKTHTHAHTHTIKPGDIFRHWTRRSKLSHRAENQSVHNGGGVGVGWGFFLSYCVSSHPRTIIQTCNNTHLFSFLFFSPASLTADAEGEDGFVTPTEHPGFPPALQSAAQNAGGSESSLQISPVALHPPAHLPTHLPTHPLGTLARVKKNYTMSSIIYT